MKKYLIFLTILISLPAVMAGEEAPLVNQRNPEQIFNNNRASVSVQKQPSLEDSQKQCVKNNWFCIIVQVNGKVLETLPQSIQQGG